MVRRGCLVGLLASPVVPTLGEREMKFEEKREIWDAVLECARHAPLTAPTKLAEELLAAHDLVWCDSTEEPPCSPRMPLTAEEVEAMTDSPNEISRELLLQIERREGQSRYKPLDLSRKIKDEGVENGKH